VSPRRRTRTTRHAALARDWRTIGLRGLAALLFAALVLTVPLPALASVALLFAAYIAADGVLAIIAGIRAARRGERARGLILEGSINLAAAAAILAWPATAILPLVRITSFWAILTGAVMIAAARRLSFAHRMLAFAGLISCAWGLLSILADATDVGTVEWWLVGYALLFGGSLLVLATQLQRHHRRLADALKPRSDRGAPIRRDRMSEAHRPRV
jgi:uncharacterized membrane protein HdeD (DUF308 family)